MIMKKQNQLQMKKQNKFLVLEKIRQLAPISRIQLSKLTKMSPTTITRIVQELEEEGFVRETDVEETSIGRRPTLIDLCADALFTVGIEIDRSRIRIGIINFIGDIEVLNEIKRDLHQSYEDTIREIVESVHQMLKQSNTSLSKVLGIGVGIPGVVDNEQGVVVVSEQLRWVNCPIRQDLSEHFACDIIIDNELKMQILAEIGDYYAPTYENCILIGMGSGIGAAILMNGDVYRGIKNNAGEISHVTINPQGNLCHCGNRGCLSTYVSETALIKQAQQFKPISTIEQLFKEISNGEQWALDMENNVATYIAIAINNLVCLYEPEAIIVSGDFINQNEKFQNLLQEKCSKYIWKEMQSHLQLVFSEQQNSGVVKGAALQAQKILLEV